MTAEELERIIQAFRSGGSITRSNYHAGERTSWYYDAELEQFIHRIQGLSHEDIYLRYSEEDMRLKLSDSPYAHWSDCTQ